MKQIIKIPTVRWALILPCAVIAFAIPFIFINFINKFVSSWEYGWADVIFDKILPCFTAAMFFVWVGGIVAPAYRKTVGSILLIIAIALSCYLLIGASTYTKPICFILGSLLGYSILIEEIKRIN